MKFRMNIRAGLATVISAAALVVAMGAAKAADLPTRKGELPYLSPVPAYNWGGFYFGVNGGYGWGHQDPLGAITNRFDSASFNTSGGMLGGTMGAQLQQGHVVLGVEGDLDWADISGSKTVVPTIGGAPVGLSVDLRAQDNWVGTGRLRLGFAQDNWLFFGTVGLAMLGNQPHINNILNNGVPASCATVALPNCSNSGVKGGLAAGLGVEYAFAHSWSAKAEYMYIGQLQGATLQDLNMIRVGLNYHFGG